MSRPSDGLYAEVIHVPCPTCGVPAEAKCVTRGRRVNVQAVVPCHKRIKAAESAGPVDPQGPASTAGSAAPATEGLDHV